MFPPALLGGGDGGGLPSLITHGPSCGQATEPRGPPNTTSEASPPEEGPAAKCGSNSPHFSQPPPPPLIGCDSTVQMRTPPPPGSPVPSTKDVQRRGRGTLSSLQCLGGVCMCVCVGHRGQTLWATNALPMGSGPDAGKNSCSPMHQRLPEKRQDEARVASHHLDAFSKQTPSNTADFPGKCNVANLCAQTPHARLSVGRGNCICCSKGCICTFLKTPWGAMPHKVGALAVPVAPPRGPFWDILHRGGQCGLVRRQGLHWLGRGGSMTDCSCKGELDYAQEHAKHNCFDQKSLRRGNSAWVSLLGAPVCVGPQWF